MPRHQPGTVGFVLTFVDPLDVDVAYSRELAAAADRLLETGRAIAPIAEVLAGRAPIAILGTLRVVGAGLLARCYAEGASTAGAASSRLSDYIAWLFGLEQGSDAHDALQLAAKLIAADFTPDDIEVTRAANRMPASRLMVGVAGWVLGAAIVITSAIDDELPGGDSIRWIFSHSSDPAPDTGIRIADAPFGLPNG